MAVSGHTTTTTITLTSKTPIFGQKLYVVIAVTVAAITSVLLLILLCLCCNRSSKRRSRMRVKHSSGLLPLVPVPEAIDVEMKQNCSDRALKVAKTLKSRMFETDNEENYEAGPIIEVVEGKVKENNDCGSNESSAGGSEGAASSVSVESLSNIGWGRWYSLSELEIATNGFAEEKVIGEGGYGIVYRGVVQDGSVVAVKKLLNNKGQAEKEFKVEVEAIGKVRHKNLVGLVGFCAEGSTRLLVYEYADNGNLEQRLHGDVGAISPLNWDIRMRIAVGTAKGLAYLHEGLEPKVVHRDVKSSNILLDKKWNAKVSDFGLAKLLGSDKSYVATRVMGTFGYVSPDYASTGMLNEYSDIYSFGVLLIEIITGRSPVDHSRAPGEMNLVDWFKGMVVSHRGEELLDPKLEVRPSPRALKRVLLTCLRCVDMDASKRPKMGQIVQMLEADDFSFRSEPRPPRAATILRLNAAATSKVPAPSENMVAGRW